MATLKNTTIDTTGAIQLPVGTTAQRPTASAGHMRYNSTFKTVETYDGTRWRYMPDIVREGLVLNLDAGEPSSYLNNSINLLNFSEQFDNAVWSKSGVVISTNATTAPDGTLTAELMTEDTGTNAHWLFYSTAPYTANTYTLSIFAKQAVGSRYLRFSGFGLDAISESPIFDISSGIVYTPSTTTRFKSASIIPYPNGWYRCICTIEYELSVGQRPFFRMTNSTTNFGNYSYTGDGTSGFYIWGAQLETGSSATDYIPKVGGGTIWADLSGNGNNGTLVNGVGYNSANGGSLVFDGTNDYSTVPDITGVTDFSITNNYTVDFWFYANSTQNNTSNPDNDVVEKWSGVGGYPYVFRYIRASQIMEVAVYNGTSVVSTNIQISHSNWWNICGVFNWSSSLLIVYGNSGIKINSATLNLTGDITNTSDLNLMRRGDNTNYTTGNLTSLKIYNRALTPQEIQQNYLALKGRFS